MEREEIKKLLDAYGFQHIIKENGLTTLDVLELLSDLGYINLEGYCDEE
jgi:hypothetical protein